MFKSKEKGTSVDAVSADGVLVILGGIGAATAAGIAAYFRLRKAAA